MEKETLQPLSGFRDQLGPLKAEVIGKLEKVFRSFGYQRLETPVLEKQAILLNKFGPEAEKLLYLFEDNGGRKVGLRYDLTVPLSRFVALNYGSLTLPFKRYEIGRGYRAEKAQKGRYREFTQADVDIVGCSSLAAEAELLAIIAQAGAELALEFECLINDRRLVNAVFSQVKVESATQAKLLQLLDKKDKLTSAELNDQLERLALSEIQQKQIRSIFLEEGDSRVLKGLVESELIEALEKLERQAKALGLKAKIDLSMVRGLDYYTGTVIECRLPGYPSSLVGGGRYDTLVESLIGQAVPSVGISFGVDRLVDYLTEKAPAQLEGYFVVNLPATEEAVKDWLSRLRPLVVELYLDSAVELGKQLKYADKRGYSKVLIPLPELWAQGKIAQKDLQSGKQAELDLNELE